MSFYVIPAILLYDTVHVCTYVQVTPMLYVLYVLYAVTVLCHVPYEPLNPRVTSWSIFSQSHAPLTLTVLPSFQLGVKQKHSHTQYANSLVHGHAFRLYNPLLNCGRLCWLKRFGRAVFLALCLGYGGLRIEACVQGMFRAN